MTDPDPAYRSTDAARSPSRLLELGLLDEASMLAQLQEALPQYDQFERIGAGGMGVVWSARQTQLDRRVAIKVMQPELADDPSFAERFGREARALAKLQHPGIVTVHDFGSAAGMCFLVMEYVDGTDLRSLMRTGLAADQALAIVPQICEALQYAHDHGVVHRDVKPENILVDRAGRVRIADFGLARLRGSSESRHSTGRVLGTPIYMAPEQIDAPSSVDHRADIYALGVVIYEMLTGKLPIGRFSPPSALQPVDVRLDAVVLRSLEHDRDRRYQHASEVRERVVAIGPSHAHLRPDDSELEARIAADRSFSAAVVSGTFGTWFVATVASGIWWNDSGFGYAQGTNFPVRVGWFFAAVWIVFAIRLWIRRRRCEEGSRLAHALNARLGALFVLGLLGFEMATLSGKGFYVPLLAAVWAGYSTWLEAVKHRIPARIVLGPAWWLHRWEAGLEPDA